MSKNKPRRCTSKENCNDNKPGIKETLPLNYDKKFCQNCVNKMKIKENKRCKSRREVVKIAQKYVDDGKYLCYACAKKGNIKNEDDVKKWVLANYE